MAIIQISKIQVRSGDLVDLPQLDEAEFGWASDAKKLYIGKTTPNENIEILTTYSNIYFSQLVGSFGNLNVNAPTDGQIFVYNQASNNWVNGGGTSSQTINLGSVSDIKVTGGATGYILQTDGTGNLSWTTNGTLYTPIIALTNGAGNVITMTVNPKVPYTNGQSITISGAVGSNTTPVNGKTFYVKLATDYANSSGNVTLYQDSLLTTTANGSGLNTNNNTGIATAVILSGAGVGATAGGSTYSIQYNSSGLSTGDANFQWNYTTQSLSLTGTANVSGNINSGNINTTGQLVSTVATGTTPLKVNSTTRVANLNSATSGIANTVNDSAQPNITSVGTLTSLSVTGNIAGANVIGNMYGNGAALSSITGANVTGQVANALIAGTVYTNAQPNITSVGILTSLSVSGNANVGNIGTGIVTATGNITGSNIVGNHYGNGATLSSITGANVTGTVSLANNASYLQGYQVASAANATAIVLRDSSANIYANYYYGNGSQLSGITGANVTGTVANATYALGAGSAGSAGTAGTVTTAAQPNITSVGILTSLNVTGKVTAGQLQGDGGNISNITAGNITGQVANSLVAGTVTTNAQPNITSVGTLNGLAITGNLLLTGGGYLYTTNMSTGANTASGTITGNWTLTSGSKLQATYADLAEYYEADQQYEPGNVLEFGGDKEVTLAQDGTTRVAGVVTTNPAYVMNTGCQGIAVAIALQGRVPVKVRGRVSKGDMMVSAGNGYARPWNNPSIGMVIGKSLENFEGGEGVIEIAVGRL